MKHYFTLVVVGILLWVPSAPAFDYVEMTSLAERISPKIQDCRTTDQLTVPIRTSGAYVVPLMGNGYALSTEPDSLFGKRDLDVRLVRQNRITDQLAAYMACEMPILGGTQGMINLAADITEADPRTEMVAIYQHAWSNGGDALVARASIKTPADLSGARIAAQAYGPHLEYANRVIADARRTVKEGGGTWTDPTLVYTEDLLGFDGHTPGRAFLSDDGLDAAFVMTADANVLTSGGTTGTGAEGSVKGAHILLSTKSASRVLSEIYVVRRDFFEKNRETVQAFVSALLKAEELVREDVLKLIVDWEAVARHLLDDPGATADARALWAGVETVGMRGNVDWADPQTPRSFATVNNEIQNGFVDRGLMRQAYALDMVRWDYGAISGGLFDQRRAELPGFDEGQAGQVVDRMKQTGDLEKETLFAFEINFKPNQQGFPVKTYEDEFDRVIELASTYGGAVLTVEGHSDPLNYLRRKAKGAPRHELRSIRQAARNLSVNRAMAVRDAIIELGESRGVSMDESQFVTVGYGITEPKTGMCGGDPCPPKTEAEWRSNMRVSFRIVQVEAEADVFTPINTW